MGETAAVRRPCRCGKGREAMSWRRFSLPVALLGGLPLVLYAPLLFGGKVLYWGVYLLQFYPWRQLAVEQIRAGHWPLWNPYLGTGAPLAANLQTAAFYPPNLLFLLMPVERAFGWALALHVALAGLFAYYLARTLRLTTFGSLVSGLAYGLGGYVVARWVFPSMVYAAAWLPLMLALVERIVQQAGLGRPRDWLPGLIWRVALLATATALQLLAGHAQTSFYSLLILAALALWRAWQTRGAGGAWRRAMVAVTGLSLAMLWAAALAAVQLLPSAELAAHSQRSGGLTDTQFAYALSFWPWRLITLLAPDFFGNPARGGYWAFGTYWEEAAFVGILPLILAALALAAWWRQRGRQRTTGPVALVPVLAGLALASLLLALGRYTPLYPLFFRYVPGFGLFQAPARLVLGYALAVPLLAGIGADAVRLTSRSKKVLRALLLAGLGTAAGGVVALVALSAVPPSFGRSALRLGVAVALAAALLLFRGRQGWRGTRWQALAVALVAVDLLAFGWGLAPGTDPAVYRAPVDSAAFLQAQEPGRIWHLEGYADQVYDRYVALGDFGPSAPTYLQPLRESLLPNLNAVHHLPGAGNYDPLVIEGYSDLYEQLLGPEGQPRSVEEVRPILDLFGVGYLLTDAEMDLPVLYDAGPRIYRNPTALPRVLIVHGARILGDADERLQTILDPGFDPREEVVLSRAPSAFPAGTDSAAVSAEGASMVDEEPQRVTVQVELTQDGYLVLLDSDYPGWRVTVNGQPAEILMANHAFRAVALGPGRHSVTFAYVPLSFHAGAWITGISTTLLVAVVTATCLWRSRSHGLRVRREVT